MSNGGVRVPGKNCSQGYKKCGPRITQEKGPNRKEKEHERYSLHPMGRIGGRKKKVRSGKVQRVERNQKKAEKRGRHQGEAW